MAPHNLDRLTAIDASFLHQEGPSAHMHIGALVRAAGPPPAYDDFLDSIRMRLHLVPRYRQRLVFPPAASGRPLWTDDVDFNLEYHVRHTALPRPGSDEQLTNLAARVFSQQLDRSKPLWELWLVEGLAGGGFALLTKSHHAMVDGIAGVDLGTVLFDLGPEPAPPPEGLQPWTPDPEPSPVHLLSAGVAGMAKASLGVAAKALGSLANPERTWENAKVAAEGLGEIAWAGLNPAPPSPLNLEIGPHRRFAGVACELMDFKTVKNVLGGTVNDVVLAVVAGALRNWLHSRGVRTQGLELRALVPVSVRSREERNGTGNRLAVMRGPLPVYIEDPIERLDAVRLAMDDLKESKQAIGAEVLTSMQQFAPPTVLAQASRLNFSTRLFNMLVTNVPGPQFPLYVQGREMTSIFPIAFLPKDHALAIAIMSYNGQMNFGLLGDYDAMPDLDAFGEAIEAALAELVSLAARQARASAASA
ncbi:MAG: diacylglycerol O-acyltransferase / wax synthase [Solirubrobacteraceae bacterium]|jgi:WS/DGAT/MGAT family acyltransferase|nr:diacylglycerol O-acyltransferase / wax synthase [Solirubrobacteraceae bacterium]